MRLPPVLSWAAGLLLVKTLFLSLIIGFFPASHAIHIPIRPGWSQHTLFGLAIQDDLWDQTLAFSKKVEEYSHVIFANAMQEFADVSDKISELKENAAELVIHTREFRESVHVDWEQFEADIAPKLQDVLGAIKKEFPPPDKAPNHAQRGAMIGKTLQDAEDQIVTLCMQRGFSGSEDELRTKLNPIMGTIEKIATLAGDIFEQHPVLLSTIGFAIVAAAIPEGLFLRPILGLFGWGPYGPVKGSAAAWIQRMYWGAAVRKGSWFSILQHLGAKGVQSGIARKIGVAIGAAIGAALGFIWSSLSCFRR